MYDLKSLTGINIRQEYLSQIFAKKILFLFIKGFQMKKNLLIMLITFVSKFSFATTDGLQASSPKPPAVIAEVQVIVAFGPPDSPRSQSVEILDNGTVQEKLVFQDQKIKIQKLATLASQVLRKVSIAVESTLPGELFDINPDQPVCMDAPTTVYYAIKKSGEKIAIAKQMQCHEFAKTNGTSSDYILKRTLSGLTGLASTL